MKKLVGPSFCPLCGTSLDDDWHEVERVISNFYHVTCNECQSFVAIQIYDSSMTVDKLKERI